jgi:hypothetical protein
MATVVPMVIVEGLTVIAVGVIVEHITMAEDIMVLTVVVFIVATIMVIMAIMARATGLVLDGVIRILVST